MAKKNPPAWQQVVQIALDNVRHRGDGYDAWSKLNEEEQAAVRSFLTEHCGEDADAALEETCRQIKNPKWCTYFWVIFSFVILMGSACLCPTGLRNGRACAFCPSFGWWCCVRETCIRPGGGIRRVKCRRSGSIMWKPA